MSNADKNLLAECGELENVTTHPPGTVYIEIQGLYDGWSVAKLPDGTLVNRWPEESYRHYAVQEWIDAHRRVL